MAAKDGANQLLLMPPAPPPRNNPVHLAICFITVELLKLWMELFCLMIKVYVLDHIWQSRMKV
jgi:hypothetical protein